METNEIWRSAPGFEGLYEVSNMGRVHRLWMPVKGRYVCRFDPPRLLTLNPKGVGGYVRVVLQNRPRSRTVAVHILVAEAFLGARPPRMHVAHLNGVPTDNRLSNLAYVTPGENQAHKVSHGTLRTGESLSWSKLTPETVRAIRAEYRPRKRGFGPYALGRKYGVSSTVVWDIVRGKKWRYVDGAPADHFNTALTLA